MIPILLALAAQTLTTSTPLADKDGDGRVALSKAIAPFKRGETLTLCAGQPRYTYAIVCPALGDPMAVQGELTPFSGRKYWQNVYPQQPINGKLIERMSLVCGDSCIRFGRASTSGTVRDSEIRAAALATKCSEIDTGIGIGGSKGGVATTGILIERVWSRGWKMAAKCGYLNGDGLVINRGVKTVTIRNSRFDDNADAGVDSKAADLVLDNVSASGNGHYGYRFWGGVRATTLVSINNAWGHVEAEATGRVVIDKLIAVGPGELVTTNGAAIVEIKSCDLTRWTGPVAVKRQGKPLATVTLGPTCVKE